MNKLDVVQFLITEIKYEEELYKVIEADIENMMADFTVQQGLKIIVKR